MKRDGGGEASARKTDTREGHISDERVGEDGVGCARAVKVV
jgi:hypothetical protein